MDISFVKDETLACSGLFVFDLSDDYKLIYEDLDTELITMDQPYAPGFLAYREAPFLLRKLEKLKTENPQIYPQCIFIDGKNIKLYWLLKIKKWRIFIIQKNLNRKWSSSSK